MAATTDSGDGDFERAARRVLNQAKAAGDVAVKERARLEDERRRLERQARDIERRLQASGGTGRNAEASTQTAASKRTRIADIDEQIRAMDREAKAVEESERRKTTAVQEGTRKRNAARKTEKLSPAQERVLTRVAGGDTTLPRGAEGRTVDNLTQRGLLRVRPNRKGGFDSLALTAAGRRALPQQADDPRPTQKAEQAKTQAVEDGTRKRSAAKRREVDVDAEANRIIAENNRRMAAALNPAQRAEFQRRSAPLPAAQQAAAAAELEQARQRPFTPLVAGSVGGGGRDVTAYLREQDARIEARVAKEQEAQETRRLIAAEARERTARERAAVVKAEEARKSPTGPGTAIVPRTLANAGVTRRDQLAGPIFGEYPYAPRSGPAAIGFGAEPTMSGRPVSQIADQAPGRRQQAQMVRDAQQTQAATEAHAANLAYNARQAQAMAQREAMLQDALRGTGTQLGLVDQGMRKHGALTTEFINAAVKGTASYREWGYQIGATAAKFAGWTAVSIPVFAALDGVRQIGQGAIASSSGVQQLQRVMSNVKGSDAQATFRDLSSQFNVPIEDASDALFRMAQVFHNLPDATDAARAALYSFKVGGVDVETSTRNLTAIVNGFGLSGSDLLHVFDQINQAQNQFGVAINNTEAGMAKASGSFKNAGGSLSYLLALIATGQKTTGRTGENIGTAIQRSVGFIQRPKNQQALRELGIDPTRDIDEVYNQAFAKARGLHGAQLQNLATALSSPQYASYFVPILQNQGLFRQIQQQTSPAASQNSAQRELGHTLDQLDEQIHKVGNSLERIGSGLASSNFTAPLQGMLGGLNGVLGVAGRVLHTFGQMPSALQAIVVGLVQVRAALAVARRVGLGESLQGSPLQGIAPFLIENPQRRARRAIQQGADDSVGAARDEQQRAVSRAYRAVSEASQVQQAGKAQLAAIDAAGYDEVVDAEERAKIHRRMEIAYERSLEASHAATSALRQTEREEIFRQRIQGAGKGLRGNARDAAIVAAAQREGAYVNPSLVLDRPLSERVRRADTLTFDPTLGQVTGGGPDEQIPARSIRQGIRGGAGKLADAMRADNEAVRAMSAQYGTAAGVLARAEVTTQRGSQIIGGATSAARNLAGSMRGLGRSVLEFIGPWGLIFAAMDLIPAAYQAAKDALGKRDAALANTTQTASNARQLRDQINAAQKDLATGTTRGDVLAQAGALLHGNFGFHATTARHQQDAAFLNAQGVLQQAQREAVRPNGAPRRAAAGLTVDVINQSADADYKAYQQGAITLRELRRRVEIRLTELKNSQGASGDQLTAAKQNIQARLGAVGNRGDFYKRILGRNSIDEVSSDVLDDQSAGLEAIISSGQATTKQVEKYRAELLLIVAQNRGKTDKASAQKLADATQKLTQVPEQAAQAELQRALAISRTQRQRDRAYDDYYKAVNSNAGERGLLGQTNRVIGSDRNQLGTSLARQVKLQRDMGRAIASGDVKRAAEDFLKIGAERGKQSGLESQLGRLQDQGRRIRKAWKDGAADRKAAVQAMRDQQFQDNQALEQARTAVEASTRQSGAPRLRYEIERQGQIVRQTIQRYGRDSTQALSAIQQQNELNDQLVQQQLSDLQARGTLNESRVGDRARGGVTVQDLRDQLAFMKAHPQQFGQGDIDQVQAQINNQLRQNAQDEKQRAKREKQRANERAQRERDLIEAHYAYLQSLTDDPVRIAALDVQKDRELLKHTKGLSKADRIGLNTQLNQDRRAKTQAVVDDQLDTLDYQHDIGKLTDQAWIAGMQKILDTMKLGKAARKQLAEQIGRAKHDIEQDGQDGLELNPGNIKLPTAYEIRRAVQGGRTGVTQVTNAQQITVIVQNEAAAKGVARIFRQTMGTTGAAVGRNMGVR